MPLPTYEARAHATELWASHHQDVQSRAYH